MNKNIYILARVLKHNKNNKNYFKEKKKKKKNNIILNRFVNSALD